MSWEDYKKITIIIPRNSVEETLIDFPLMLNLAKESGISKTDLTDVFTELPSLAHRFKLAVLDDQNNQLYAEISSWRPQFKKAILWVKVPAIDPLYETTLYLYYGAGMPPNTEYVGDVGSTAGQNVWPAFYDIVLHTNQRTYNNGVITESTTTSGNHICTGGGFYTSNLTSGYLDNAIRFNGLDNVLKSPYYWDEVPFNNFVIEVFCKAESTHEIDIQSSTNTAGLTGQRYLLAPMGSNSTAEVCLGISLGTNGVTVYEHGASHLAPVAVYAQTLGTDFHYICIRYNNKIPYIYVDGALVYTGPSSVKTNVYRPTDIGGMGYGYFCGILYEARFTNSLISEAWINLNSKTLFDQVVIYKTKDSDVGWLKTYENGVLSPWENRIKIEIDHTKIDETLLDFPVLLNISEESGVNNKNLNFLLTENILNKIALTADDGTTLLYAEKEILPVNLYAPNSPPGNNSIYVKASSQNSTDSAPYFATNRALSLISSETSTSWLSVRNKTKEQKFNIDYGRSFIAKRIYLENNHSNGGYTSWGIKDATLYGTDDYDAFLNTIYSNIDNLTELLNFTARPHILLNVSDAQYFYLDNNFLSFRYYVLRLHSNSGSNDFIGIRHIEIQEKLEINTLTIWTKIPLVKPNEITTLYLYYDANKSNNTEYIGEIGTEISKKVWSNNYVSVHHLSQINSSTSNFKDSVATYNSINTSPGNTPYTIDGRIGMNFDGANSYIDIGKNMNIVGPYTYEVLANTRTTGEGAFGRLVDCGTFLFYISTSTTANALRLSLQGSVFNGLYDSPQQIVYNSTQYLSVTWEVTNATNMAHKNIKFFKNDEKGQIIPLDAVSGSGVTPTNTIIGNKATNDRTFDGTIFEVRISNTIRSDGWLKASYHSIMDELLSYNEVETYVETPTQYYAYEGYVRNKATPVERKVLLYERTTGLLMDSTTSDNQGHYLLQTPYNTEHFIVVLDNIADYKFNPLIQDRILPNGS